MLDTFSSILLNTMIEHGKTKVLHKTRRKIQKRHLCFKNARLQQNVVKTVANKAALGDVHFRE